VVTATNGDQIFIHDTGISPAPSPDSTGGGRLTATGAVFFDGRPTIVSSELAGTIQMHPK
jgi:hypothetical protein